VLPSAHADGPKWATPSTLDWSVEGVRKTRLSGCWKRSTKYALSVHPISGHPAINAPPPCGAASSSRKRWCDVVGGDQGLYILSGERFGRPSEHRENYEFV